jgi:hypothetical protein
MREAIPLLPHTPSLCGVTRNVEVCPSENIHPILIKIGTGYSEICRVNFILVRTGSIKPLLFVTLKLNMDTFLING